MPLRILSSNVNSVNGHITHLVRIEESTAPGQTSFGPEETIGIWPEALLSSFHPSLPPTDASVAAAHEKWLAQQHNRMLLRKHHLDAMARVAHGLKGKLMFVSSVADTEASATSVDSQNLER